MSDDTAAIISAARARGAKRGGPHPGRSRDGRIEYGPNVHHGLYRRICRDQMLFRYGIIPADQCHRDADLGFILPMKRIAEDFISLNGGRVDPSDNVLQTFSRALGTQDFPQLLADIGQKALSTGWVSAPENWSVWCRQSRTRDFKAFKRVVSPELPTPALIGENAEITSQPIGTATAETSAVQSYAEIVSVSRQALVNDDLRALTTDLLNAGRAVSRLIGNLAYAVLTNNGDLADGSPLFDAVHLNVGTSGAPSVTTMDQAFQLMGSQVGPSAEPLNLKPRFVLSALGLASTLAILRSAMNSANSDGLSDGIITTLFDSRLSGTGWYVFCDPAISAVVEIVTLEGANGPRFEQRKTTSDASFFLVGHDVVALASDFRGGIYNAGS